MPTYSFRNTQTGEEFDEFMSFSDRESYLADNPHIEQFIRVAPGMADPTRLGMTKPEQGFRDLLKDIKKKHIRSNINTW